MAVSILSRDRLEELLGSRRDRILALGVKRLGLFGSFARDESNPESDIDFLVEFESGQKNYANFFALAELLEGTLQRRVELVTRESLSPYIGPQILREVRDVPLRA